jgi:hypothetical protein
MMIANISPNTTTNPVRISPNILAPHHYFSGKLFRDFD